MKQRTILCVDYHDENCVVRQYDGITGHETVQQIPTEAAALSSVVTQAKRRRPNTRVDWIQESTTGWVRVKALLGNQVDQFLLANTLSQPKRPKDHRRKTDKTDTQRILHEHLLGRLGLSDQPSDELREARRLVGYREYLVRRQTSIKNWIDRYLAHETWESRAGLWTVQGRRRFEKFIEQRCPSDRLVLRGKLDEYDTFEVQRAKMIAAIHELYQKWPAAKRLDAIKGIAVVSAVSIVARIGDIRRFPSAEHLIGYAGLNPGVRQSDGKRQDGHLGGGGTDQHLRHYLIEASVWARKVARYRPVYERVLKRRGKRIARLQVCRMLLRSIYTMLRDEKDFSPSLEVTVPS